MLHDPIFLNSVSLNFSRKVCFENFSFQVPFGSRIAIIGRNGTGKSSLLKMLNGEIEPTSGNIPLPESVQIGYVPQIINDLPLSGAQRFQKALSSALSNEPNLLLLDEPTNHLDQKNRKNLFRMLSHFHGTVIIVSHDEELLHNHANTFWHIKDSCIEIFSGKYDDYMNNLAQKHQSLEKKLSLLQREKKEMHSSLMQEQKRSAKSKAKGKKSIKEKKWPTVVSHAKAGRAEQTSGRKKNAINRKKNEIVDEIASLDISEIILPTFSLSPSQVGNHTLLSVSNGKIEQANLQSISLSMESKERIALKGDNGSGKTTLVKCFLDDPTVKKEGTWSLPKKEKIGYLDQHYSNLPKELSAIESLAKLVPHWSMTKLRCHLNHFLFRTKQETETPIKHLSGGEKARLSLACISAATPQLLILDEVTNNIDLETKRHLIQVLKAYPAAMIIISHDEMFLREILIDSIYEIKQGQIYT